MVFRVVPNYYDSFFSFPFSHIPRTIPDYYYSSSRYCPTIEPSYTYRRGSSATYLEVELPGVSREHVNVEVDERKLIIKGKRFQNEPGQCCVKERGKGDDKHPVVEARYVLVLRLGSDIDTEEVKADHCGNGVLVVTIPRKARHVRKVELGL